jgi:hypothetical protein
MHKALFQVLRKCKFCALMELASQEGRQVMCLKQIHKQCIVHIAWIRKQTGTKWQSIRTGTITWKVALRKFNLSKAMQTSEERMFQEWLKSKQSGVAAAE